MLVGRPGLSPVMVGRAAELDRLAVLPDPADAPAVALLGGEAGVGKTRLVRELCERLPVAVRVLAGQADPGALGRPFELLLDAISAERGVSQDALAIVTDAGAATDERVEAALGIVTDLARQQPTVVVFDDLHWADAQSVALFERLAEPGSGPVLLVGTYRPDSLTRRHPAAELLPRLERRRAVVHLHLDRLTIPEVSAFLAAVYGRSPSYRVVETLHARTGGNPFFLEELLSAAGEADPDQICSQPLPWNIGELVRTQLEDLDPNERKILEAAAVLGRRVSFDLLAAVTATGEDELIAILRALVAAGMLVETETDIFSFRHALAREAIEVDLLGRERRRLHEAALHALQESHSTDLASIAHHAHGAGRYDDLVRAAREGAAQYLESGSTYQALQLAELGLTEATDDIELLAIAARAAWLAGLVDDAIEHAARLLDVARATDDVLTESEALRRLIRLRWEAGEFEEMERTTDDVIKLVDRLPYGDASGKAMAAIAQSYMLRDNTAAAVEWADRAIALADDLDLPGVRVWARAEKGSALTFVPELADAGFELLADVADEAERLGEFVIVARALNNRVRSELFGPDPDEAREVLTRMRRAAERAGFDSLAGAGYWQGLARLSEWEGDLDAALGYLEEGHRRGRSTLRTGKASWYQVHEAGLALEAGELDRADALFTELASVAGENPVWWHGLGVHLAARHGDLGEARRRLPGLVAAITKAGGADAQLVHDVSAGLLGAGASVDEVRLLLEHGAKGEGQPLPPDSPWLALLAAQLLEAEHRDEEAVAKYEEVTTHASHWLRPATAATAHVGASRSLIALGRLTEARVHVDRAAALLARWRGWRVAELLAVQRRLGMGTVAAGPDTLTPREREVAALLAEGLTNAELAARLYISPKTAAVHVSNMLAKLGMASRAEIAAFAVREEMLSSHP